MSRSYLLFFAALCIAPELSAAPAKDPKIVALASAAAKCKFEDDYFDEECKAYKAWVDEGKLFAEGKGDLTLLAMLEDPDVKQRILAVDHGFDAYDTLATDKAIATRILAAAKKETDPKLARYFGNYVSRIDLEKLGFEAELEAMPKHPNVDFRDGLAYHLYADKQTALRLEITKIMLADSEPKVVSSALKGLSLGASRGKKPEACALMGQQISRTDSEPLWQVATSECTSVYDALATEILKRATDPVRGSKDGVPLSLALGAMCRAGNAAQKAKGFTAAKALTDSKIKNPNARSAGIGAMSECDKVAAKPVLATLSKDGDKFVAEQAAKELAKVDKK